MGHDNRSLSPAFDADGEAEPAVAVDGFDGRDEEHAAPVLAAATGHVTDSERFNWSLIPSAS